VAEALTVEDEIAAVARRYADARSMFFLGRVRGSAVAREGAQKLKEISYVHAEGYPAAEMKHGPIALIDANMPVVFLCTKDGGREKVMSNMQEVKARHGKIVAIATEGDAEVHALADFVIPVPQTIDAFTPLLSVIPLQLLLFDGDATRLQRRHAAEPREVGDGRVTTFQGKEGS